MKEIIGRYTEGMKTADLHIHTNVSPDTRGRGLEPEEVVDLASDIDLNLIAITDHHEISGAQKANEYALKNEMPVEVVAGIEVTTDKGHVLGLYVRDKIDRTDFKRAIYEIHRQNGIVIIPHPFFLSISAHKEALLDVLSDESGELWIDGFEVFSQGTQDYYIAKTERADEKEDKPKTSNERALYFFAENSQQLGAPVASSDAHGLTIGRAQTAYHGNLAKAIEEQRTIPLELNLLEQAVILDKSRKRFGQNRLLQRRQKGLLKRYGGGQPTV